MDPEYLGLDAVGWHWMLRTWWEKLLGVLLLTTIVSGLLYVTYFFGKRLHARWKGRRRLSVVPLAVSRYLNQLKTETPPLSLTKDTKESLKTFGVFLGRFLDPPTPSQTQLLSQWDILVVDSLQDGVLDTISSNPTSSCILGRLDVENMVRKEYSSLDIEVVKSLRVVTGALISHFKRKQDRNSPFYGVLLAGWSKYFQPVVLNELVQYINGIGLHVWLEMAPPRFLCEQECRTIDLTRIGGIVYRNGTIFANGEQRNYFQMAEMRTVMRVAAAQKTMGGSTLAMWETVDDDVEIAHDVLQRSLKWCNYNSAMSWIGPKAAVVDADVAVTRTVMKEPLGALMWLKEDRVLEAHDQWRFNVKICQESSTSGTLYRGLETFIPNLTAKLSVANYDMDPPAEAPVTQLDAVDWLSGIDYPHVNPFSASDEAVDYTGLGCFQLGLDCTVEDIAVLLEAQRTVRDLDLLGRVQPEELRWMAKQLRVLHRIQAQSASRSATAAAILELINLLSTSNNRIRVWVGLHSGFRRSTDTQVWGMYDIDTRTGGMDIYLSGKTIDRTGVLLHTFLSSKNFSRFQCFMAEMALSEAANNLSVTWGLPPRLVNDVEDLSPAETILWLQRLAKSTCEESSVLAAKVRACCEYQIMDVPCLGQLRTLSSKKYLSGNTSAEEVVSARLAWYRGQGLATPHPSVAFSLFKEIDTRVPEVLIEASGAVLAQLAGVMHTILQAGHIDAKADFFALSVFCAFRRLALNEIYLEVLDRNPYPNIHPVQASSFAENYAVGARCDAYLDMNPRAIGDILSDRIHAYYMKHQPPRREESFTELPTAYASMDIDLDPNGGQEDLPFFYRVSFLGIFAVPALIDITLLTTIGRGLYLTTFMSEINKTLTTTALMVALLLCGGFGGWISSGGSYYLYAMAFPAMSMFVLTRFVAGVAVVTVGGTLALIGIGVAKGFVAGVVFFAYVVMLTTYLLTLSALAIYQLPGFQFQSGRTVITMSIPILFVSPLLTLWLQHDIIIYPCVIVIFLTVLLLRARRVISRWNNWYLNIPCITDGQVVDWYRRTQFSSNSQDGSEQELASTALARLSLVSHVQRERKRWHWTRSTADPLVKKLAEGYSATMFLLVWYCKFSRTKLPLPYSPTWNLQLKAAVDTLGDMQKGLKMHNAFLHWRHTGKDVWGGILYFIVALMDKWSALFTGEAVVGLLSGSNQNYRLGVGFGLGYYLMGAVILDAVSQPLWNRARQTTSQPVDSLGFLRQATLNDFRNRRSLYWRNMARFFFLYVWAIAITCALMWSFEASRDATIMYLAYVGAYMGLLWYQYNRIYTGCRSDSALTTGAIIGVIVCMSLRCLRSFAFGGVIGLAAATWTAAIASFVRANVGWPCVQTQAATQDDSTAALYTYSCLEPDPKFSQATLAQTFDAICTLSPDLRCQLAPAERPGVEVMQILRSPFWSRNLRLVHGALPFAKNLLKRTTDRWESGDTVVELVSARHLLQPQQEQTIRAIARYTGDKLHIFLLLGLDLVEGEWVVNVGRNCRTIAETLVQMTAEHQPDVSHNRSLLTELLLAYDYNNGMLAIPEGVKRQLEISPSGRERVIAHRRHTLLRHLLLGLECDQAWDELPRTARAFLVQRACGEACQISATQVEWIRSRIPKAGLIDPREYIARYDLRASLSVMIASYAKRLASRIEDSQLYSDFRGNSYDQLTSFSPTVNNHRERLGIAESIKLTLIRLQQKIRSCIKFTVISLVADPEYQRELNYVLRAQPLIFSWPVTWILTATWSFCRALQLFILPSILLYGRPKVATLYKNMKGQKTVLGKDRIMLESLDGPFTCFIHTDADGSCRLYQYSGRHEQEPSQLQRLAAVNVYTDKLFLNRREEYDGQGSLLNEFTYDYSQDNDKSPSKLPIQRQCIVGELGGQVVQYDRRGYIVSGSAMRGVNPVQFQYWYRKHAKLDDELLRAEYVFPHIKIKVAWSMPPLTRPEQLDRWIPYPRVTEAVFVQDADVYVAQWTYHHKFHPTIDTTLNGEPTVTPAMIHEDWFHVLQKPGRCSFINENPLLLFSSVKPRFIYRRLGLHVKQYPVSTSRARTHLWKSWKATKEFDAVTTCWLDEVLMRSDRVLRPYWRRRDWGQLEAASDYLDAQADTILARVDIDPEVSSWTPIAFKISDLFSFGQGGDARINTRTLSTQLQDNEDELHVLAMDTGTWPNEPGGVSACRRDMVNDLKSIRWHIIAEAANDFGVPRFQIERNVHSLTVLPQWGLDFLNPTHGIFQNSLDSAVVEKAHDTIATDIKSNFLPILTSLVRCSRTIRLTRLHVEEATRALVDLNTYFESTRSWNDVWLSDIVKQAWRELWLSEDMPGTVPISQWLNAERPTILQLDTALDMWHRYLFIFSIPVPDRIPHVFQASHHFTGATYGVLCKMKRQCALHVWDHCISFREMTTFLSSAVSFDSTFVNNTLIGLGHLSCVLIEHHADVVLPCAEYFNPGWEIELGTGEGALQHRRIFRRKIDPVVNGITNMEKYKPIETIKTRTPTVVMLSHIRYVKDIKTAIMATDLIVNSWGFKDYRLHIYGDMERAPAYASECQEIIATKGLREHVVLMGLGNPSVVLQDAWLFMNSSISEGLPLAMGEAALTGVPVVCTDVGASFCVVTDRESGKRFSEVVAPNDAISLASAQLRILALLGQWSAFAEDEECYQPPTLSLHPTHEEIQQISQRMYEKAEQRRRLGMLGRSNILNNFSSNRYLREHEQMMWLGKHQSRSYVARGQESTNSSEVFKDKRKHSILVEQTEVLPTPEPVFSWSSFQMRPRLKRGYRSAPLAVEAQSPA